MFWQKKKKKLKRFKRYKWKRKERFIQDLYWIKTFSFSVFFFSVAKKKIEKGSNFSDQMSDSEQEQETTTTTTKQTSSPFKNVSFSMQVHLPPFYLDPHDKKLLKQGIEYKLNKFLLR